MLLYFYLFFSFRNQFGSLRRRNRIISHDQNDFCFVSRPHGGSFRLFRSDWYCCRTREDWLRISAYFFVNNRRTITAICCGLEGNLRARTSNDCGHIFFCLPLNWPNKWIMVERETDRVIWINCAVIRNSGLYAVAGQNINR